MVVIGITGHRFLAEVDRIEHGIELVVERLDTTHPGAWTVASALAEGADRLAAERLLDRPGSRLLAVLPLPRADYVADFPTEASRHEFADLLAGADEIVELAPPSGRDEAYEAGGRAVLDQSDVLLAVWDGKGAQGQGGTGGVVAEARRRRMPVAWVHAGNRRPGTTEATSLGPEQGTVTFERLVGSAEVDQEEMYDIESETGGI